MSLPVQPESAANPPRLALSAKELLIRDALMAYEELRTAFAADQQLQAAFRRLHIAQTALAALHGEESQPTTVSFTYQVDENVTARRAPVPLDSSQPYDALSAERDARVNAGKDIFHTEIRIKGGTLGGLAKLIDFEWIYHTETEPVPHSANPPHENKANTDQSEQGGARSEKPHDNR